MDDELRKRAMILLRQSGGTPHAKNHYPTDRFTYALRARPASAPKAEPLHLGYWSFGRWEGNQDRPLAKVRAELSILIDCKCVRPSDLSHPVDWTGPRVVPD